MPAKPAAFLDRDGVLNVDSGYAHRPDQIVWIDGASQAVRRLNRAGYHVFVVTNQAGIARGLYEEADVVALHQWMAGELAKAGARVDDWRYSPSHPDFPNPALDDRKHWRKPEPGMLRDLMDGHPVEINRSFMIGDRQSDMEAAAAAGVPGFFFEAGNLDDFVAEILAQLK